MWRTKRIEDAQISVVKLAIWKFPCYESIKEIVKTVLFARMKFYESISLRVAE